MCDRSKEKQSCFLSVAITAGTPDPEMAGFGTEFLCSPELIKMCRYQWITLLSFESRRPQAPILGPWIIFIIDASDTSIPCMSLNSLPVRLTGITCTVWE